VVKVEAKWDTLSEQEPVVKVEANEEGNATTTMQELVVEWEMMLLLLPIAVGLKLKPHRHHHCCCDRRRRRCRRRRRRHVHPSHTQLVWL
jgi:hypothetical protein